MNTYLTYFVSIVLAMLLHVLVAWGVNYQWTDTTRVVSSRSEPLYLTANLVRENPIRAKQREQAELRKKRRAANREKRERERLAKKASEQKAAKPTEEKRLVQKVPEPVVEEEDPLPPDRAELERHLVEQELESAILQEQEFRIAVTDDEKALAYADQIKREVIQNWSRPPSARNNMQAVLKVYLVPTGEVVNVEVVESSGNRAFDDSAVRAVEKADQFDVPVDSRQFERNFREFVIIFRPEDLRL